MQQAANAGSMVPERNPPDGGQNRSPAAGGQNRKVTNMLAETVALLRDHDFIRGEESVNRDALSDAIVEILVADPVTEETQIETKAMIPAEIRYRLFGSAESEEIEDELDDILRGLLSGEGKVQDRLPSDVVLCSRTVTRRLSANGGTSITVRKKGRFVTAEAHLIVDHYVMPQKQAAERATLKLNNRIELGIKRQPLVAARRAEIVRVTHEQLQLMLPSEDAA
jgi:hypothetical protein